MNSLGIETIDQPRQQAVDAIAAKGSMHAMNLLSIRKARMDRLLESFDPRHESAKTMFDRERALIMEAEAAFELAITCEG